MANLFRNMSGISVVVFIYEEFENCEGLNIFDIKVKNLKHLNINSYNWMVTFIGKKENCFKGFDKKFFYFVQFYA